MTTETELDELFKQLSETKQEPVKDKEDAVPEQEQGNDQEETTDEQEQESNEQEASNDEQESGNEEETDEKEYVIEVHGKKYTEKDLTDLHNSGLRQEDYTKKTQELAEQKKAWELQKEEAIRQRQQELDHLLNTAKQLDVQGRKTPEEMLALSKADPYAYQELKSQYDAEDQLIAYQQKQQQMTLQQKSAQETEKLKQLEPAFAKDFESNYKATLEYLVEQGMPQEEAYAIVDANFIKLAYDSMLLNKGKNKVKIIPKTAANKQKPPTNQTKKRTEKLSSANSVNSLASLIEQDMAG